MLEIELELAALKVNTITPVLQSLPFGTKTLTWFLGTHLLLSSRCAHLPSQGHPLCFIQVCPQPAGSHSQRPNSPILLPLCGSWTLALPYH